MSAIVHANRGESVASKGAKVTKEKAEKGELSFKEMATRNVSRARKGIPDEEEGDKPATAEHLMQAAMVYAILDLADAVRSGVSSDGAAPGGSVGSG